MSRDEASREVRRAVEATGLSQAQFAESAGVDPGTLGDFLAGKRWPHGPTRAKIETALGWSAGRISDLATAATPIRGVAPLFEAIDAHPGLLPEAKQHLKNQVELLMRLQAAEQAPIVQLVDKRMEATLDDIEARQTGAADGAPAPEAPQVPRRKRGPGRH